MRDIESPDDCLSLVTSFYGAVREDALLAPIFASRVHDWGPHLATMARFWSTLLFATAGYRGDAFSRHVDLGLEPRHFARWLSLWQATLDASFRGPRADEALRRAERIATVFQRRLAMPALSPPCVSDRVA